MSTLGSVLHFDLGNTISTLGSALHFDLGNTISTLGSALHFDLGNTISTLRSALHFDLRNTRAVVWSCLPFIRSGQNHLADSKRGKKARQTEEEVGRQHQGMDRSGVRQVSESSGKPTIFF